MKVSVEKQLLIYIKYASSQQTLTEISDTYGVGEGTAHCIIHRTSSLICADMLSNLITWPSGLKVQENVEKVYQHILWVAGVNPLLKSFKKNSPLFIKTSENKEMMFPGNTHLIGDAAYGLKCMANDAL